MHNFGIFCMFPKKIKKRKKNYMQNGTYAATTATAAALEVATASSPWCNNVSLSC